MYVGKTLIAFLAGYVANGKIIFESEWQLLIDDYTHKVGDYWLGNLWHGCIDNNQ